MSWQIAVFADLILASIYALLMRTIAKKNPGKATSDLATMYVFVAAPISVAGALIINSWSISHSWQVWLAVLFVALITATGNIAAVAANAGIDAAQFSVIGNLNVVVAVVVASVFLNESLDSQQFIGALLILVAGVVIASAKFNRKTLRFDRHTVYSFVYAFTLGLTPPSVKYVIDNMEVSTLLVCYTVLQTLIFSGVALYRNHGFKQRLRRKPETRLVLAAASRGLSNFGFFYALQFSDNSALISSVRGYKVALVFLGSYLLLGEREHVLIKIIGVLLATAGLLLSL